MQKVQTTFSLAVILLGVWAIHNYDVNSSCYEIVDAGPPLGSSILLNKCKGLTWMPVKGDITISDWVENDEGVYEEVFETKKSMVWVRIDKDSNKVMTFKN